MLTYFLKLGFYDQFVQVNSRNVSEYINIVLKHTTNPRHYTLWKEWALQHIFTEEDIRNPSVNNLVQKLLEVKYNSITVYVEEPF